MTNTNSPARWPVHSFAQALHRLPFEAQRRYRNLAAAVTDTQALVRSAMERLASVDQELWMKGAASRPPRSPHRRRHRGHADPRA
jgi:hypothetical protein